MQARDMTAASKSVHRKWQRWVVWIAIALTTAFAAAVLYFGAWPLFNRIEEPRHTVEVQSGPIEIRRYAGLIAAEVEVGGERKSAINEGFRILASYIFGNNRSAGKIEMTAPVTQQARENIAMTAPVTQQAAGNAWKVRFVMPSQFTLDTLPKPNDARIRIVEDKPKRFAVIRFSGFATESRMSQERERLMAFVAERKLDTIGTPVLAFYDPPWTLPFLRRNEIMVEVGN